MMNEFKEWWAQASSRDQLFLVIGLGFVGLYIMFMLVLKPVQEMREKENVKNNALRSSLETVRGLSAQVAAQNQGGPKNSKGSKLETIVQQTVSANGLQVASMNASGKTGVRLRFDEARFENVLKWLYEMEITHNLQIKDLSVARASRSGTVTVNLRLHQG